MTLKNITAEDTENYICTSYNLQGEKLNQKQYELTVVDLPLYTINKHLVYEINEKCTLYDVDIMSLYMPYVMRTVICGRSSKACNVKIHEPYCLQKVCNPFIRYLHWNSGSYFQNDRGLISVLMSFVMNPLKKIISGLNSTKCDIDCQKKIYGKICSVIVGNVESLEKLPGNLLE